MSLWRYRGTPHHLNGQGARLGVTQVIVDRARNNQEIYRVSVLLSQLCERYHAARKENGVPVLGRTELAQVQGTLEQAEQESAKLHALAASSAEMIDEAYSAFEIARSPRPYGVACIFDAPIVPMSNGDGTVGHDDDVPHSNGDDETIERLDIAESVGGKKRTRR
jgi:hypothetical protein